MSYQFGNSVQKKYCYQDYLQLPADKKCEILEGTVYDMTPSPSTQHQRILRRLLLRMGSHLDGIACEVFNAPYDVLLTEQNEDAEDIKTVVQPDILVVCDRSKLADNYCLGAPDFIVEIVSPSSPSMDYVKKLYLYEKHKVKEYWIANYVRKEIMVFRLEDNEDYGEPEIYSGGNVTSSVLTGLKISLDNLFI